MKTWWLAASLVAAVSGVFTPLRRHKATSLPMEDGDLGVVVREVVSTGLHDCVLVVIWDANFRGASMLDYLAATTNAKQVVEVDSSGKMNRILWRAAQCRGYVLLLGDPSPIMELAEQSHHLDWDYSGRFVLAGVSRAEVDAFTRTHKGRKTEHILGIVKESDREYSVITNLLYHEDPTANVYSWQAANHHARQEFVEARPSNQVFDYGLSAPRIFPDKTNNLQGAVLNVITFLYPPSVMYWETESGSSKQWFGNNIRLMEAMAHVFNFTFRYKEPPPGELWGELTANGTWNGMVGMVARGEGDIGLANLFITTMTGREEFLGYTAPYGQEKTCFLVRREMPLPRWRSLALPFTLETWIAVLVVLLLAGPLLYIFARHAVPRDKLTEESLTFSSLYTFGVHFRASQKLVPARPNLQVFLVFLWLYVIIVTVAYSANLTAFLTVDRIPEGIRTLKQLFDSHLPVYEVDPFFSKNLVQAKNKFVKGLTARFVTKLTFDKILENTLRGRGVYINSYSHLAYIQSINTSPNGAPIVRVMQECFHPFNVAMGLQSHSPLKRNFDRVVTWVVDTGLILYWFDETLRKVRRNETAKNSQLSSKEEQTPKKVVSTSGQAIHMTIEHMQGIFIVYLVGCVTSLFVFSVEMISAAWT